MFCLFVKSQKGKKLDKNYVFQALRMNALINTKAIESLIC